MNAAGDGIHRIGFRRWYERQLIHGHLWLAACFLAIVLCASGLELLSSRAGAGELVLDATLAAGGALLAWFAWRRYVALMTLAHGVSAQANCPACRRFGFVADPPPDRPRTLSVRCARCAHRWSVTLP